MIKSKYLETTVKYDTALCTGCGMCSSVCPHGVFIQTTRIAQLVNPLACMECGACALNCPADAITVESGFGCAAAQFLAALKGSDEPSCDHCC
jgi:NAD-dependent dihydropyrimidine dehydrogenase PreA subunit